MKQILGVLTTACCLGVLVLAAGCQPVAETAEKEGEHGHGHEHGHEHDHDHADRPQSLGQAIVELKELSDSFCSAMDEDDTEAAHDPLHHLGKLLAAMPELAADTDLPEDQWKQVKEDIDQLFETFGEIDSNFHKKDGDKQAAYQDAKPTIEAGVAALEAMLTHLDEELPHDDHGHSHEEEDHDHSHEEDDHEHSHEEDDHEHSHEEDDHDHSDEEDDHDHSHEEDEESHEEK